MVFCFYVFVGLRYAFGYFGVCVAGWLVLSYPKYTGPSNFVRITSPEQFEQLVEGDRPTSKIRKTKKRLVEEQKILSYAEKHMWFVEFYVDWAPTCLHVRLGLFRPRKSGQSSRCVIQQSGCASRA